MRLPVASDRPLQIVSEPLRFVERSGIELMFQAAQQRTRTPPLDRAAFERQAPLYARHWSRGPALFGETPRYECFKTGNRDAGSAANLDCLKLAIREQLIALGDTDADHSKGVLRWECDWFHHALVVPSRMATTARERRQCIMKNLYYQQVRWG